MLEAIREATAEEKTAMEWAPDRPCVAVPVHEDGTTIYLKGMTLEKVLSYGPEYQEREARSFAITRAFYERWMCKRCQNYMAVIPAEAWANWPDSQSAEDHASFHKSFHEANPNWTCHCPEGPDCQGLGDGDPNAAPPMVFSRDTWPPSPTEFQQHV